MVMEYGDREALSTILARQATFYLDGPQRFFSKLVQQANLPEPFVMEVIGNLAGDPGATALSLVQWADNKGTNPQDPRFTVLGSLVQPLLPKLGMETAVTIVSLIFRYRLYRDEAVLKELPIQYELDLPTSSIGPQFDWYGPQDEKELQSLWQPHRVTTLDVAFIQRGLEQAYGVCLIEMLPDPSGEERLPIGTGFLVQKNLLLTNYHVIAPAPDSDPTAYLSRIVLRFGHLTSLDSKAMQEKTFRLVENPLRASSPIDRLDYALLEVESSILSDQEIRPVNINAQQQPVRGMGINLLHHSKGETMKLALGTNGVTGVYESKGLIQYYSVTEIGASGSPCFNDDWQVVALHHAQNGKYREGILFSQIKEDAALGK